jgi:hypothetical protein
VLGAEPPTPLPGGRGVAIRGNTTLVSPPLALPAAAQTLRVTLRAPGGGGLVLVRALPEDGGPEVELAALEPGPARAGLPVGVSPVAGRTVRIVLDPVPALGTAVELLRVGPVTAPLPRWRVQRGALQVDGPRGRRAVRVAGEPLWLTAPPYRPPAAARWLTIAVRGDGVVRAAAGGRRVAARAGARWRVVRVPLRPRRAGPVRLALRATPGGGVLELRRLGAVLRTPGRSGGSGSR